MKIEKAIEILYDLLQTSSREKSPESWDALKLGIEALKKVQYIRRHHTDKVDTELLGETEGEE